MVVLNENAADDEGRRGWRVVPDEAAGAIRKWKAKQMRERAPGGASERDNRLRGRDNRLRNGESEQ